MILQAFLSWTANAKAGERAKAADALARSYLHADLGPEEHRAAALAMTYLLDDPSPHVRLALAVALADSPAAPRSIIAALAEDQPEIACTVITRSPVLTETDLVDLAGRSDGMTRAFIAARPGLCRTVAAAIAEIGDEDDVLILLENASAEITRPSLRRIAERFGRCGDVRCLLLEHEGLPADARHLLVGHVADALAGCGLVQATVGQKRIRHALREAKEAAAVAIVGETSRAEAASLVEHLRQAGRLTPAFLMHALCTNKVEFFAEAMANLTGLEDRRVRSILATGRMHAVRALFEAAGLCRDIASVFVEAVFIWRQVTSSGAVDSISSLLVDKLRKPEGTASSVSELLDLVEKLERAEMRATARSFASEASLAA